LAVVRGFAVGTVTGSDSRRFAAVGLEMITRVRRRRDRGSDSQSPPSSDSVSISLYFRFDSSGSASVLGCW
ncbi:hypothetical protein A2U01_0086435, partial [Trifolium medium]|nr:hypothetical protein [Trifolium medium]